MPDRPDQPPEPNQDLERRRFFRRLAGDVVSSVGSVIGVAQSIQFESAEAARELLALGDTTGLTASLAPAPVYRIAEIDASTVGYRAPFRWDVDACRVVDQRRLPDVITELAIVGAADAVNAINDGAIVGSAVQAQVAVVAIAIVAMAARTSRPFARRATIRGAANALRLTRPGSAAMAAAIERMLARLDLYEPDAEGYAVAMGLREEAEAIVFEATNDHGALVTHGIAALPGEPEAPLHVLTFGSTGAMGGGQLGTSLSVIAGAHHAGRPVHALVAETRPLLAGSRIAAWELGQAGVPYAIVTDAAAPGCIAEGEVAAVIVAADRVAANGDVIATAGTYPLALAAQAAGVPFLVCAPTTAIDSATATGEEATIEEGRPGPVLRAGGTRVAPEGSQVRNPVQDLTPAALVTALVTEEGVLRSPFGAEIADAVAAASARRSSSPGFAELVRRATEAAAAGDPAVAEAIDAAAHDGGPASTAGEPA
jgi:methylthioribose-1-phosphate isomerase